MKNVLMQTMICAVNTVDWASVKIATRIGTESAVQNMTVLNVVG